MNKVLKGWKYAFKRVLPSDEKTVLDLIMHGLDCAKKEGLKVNIVLTEEGKIDTSQGWIKAEYKHLFSARILGDSMIYPYEPYSSKYVTNPFYGLRVIITKPCCNINEPKKYRLPRDANIWIIDGKPYSMETGHEVLQFTQLKEEK
jgi:hypothetical protein